MHQARRRCRENLAEVGRVQVGHGKPEIRVVRQVEGFGAKLEAQGFGELELAGQRRVQIAEGLAARDVAAGIAELAGLGYRIEALECRRSEPLLDRVRAVVRIADQIRAAGGVTGDGRAVGLERDVGGIVDGERRGRIVAGDEVELPPAEERANRGGRVFGDARLPRSAGYKTMARIEEGRAVFGGEVEGASAPDRWLRRAVGRKRRRGSSRRDRRGTSNTSTRD